MYNEDTLKLFNLMKHLETNPNNITFAGVLLACIHASIVDEGCKYFNTISYSYCIIPRMDYYTYIVELIFHVGYLKEALKFIVKMLRKPKSSVWMCLLGACRSHKNIVIGEFIAKILFFIET